MTLPGSPPSPWLDKAWGVTFATAGSVTFTAVGALFSDAPGDRAGGVGFGALLGLGLAAAALCRFRGASMVWILLGMVLGQIALAFLLAAHGIGDPRVVAVMTAVFATGWAVAALLMFVAHRRGGARAGV